MSESNVAPFQKPDSTDADTQRDATAARLKSYIERVERLEEEKRRDHRRRERSLR